MPIRPKILLTLLGLCLAPLLLLGVISYFNGMEEAESELLRDLERELDNFIAAVSDHVDEQENELIALADSKALRDYLQSPAKQLASPANDQGLTGLKIALAETLSKQSHLLNISFFDQQKRPVFFAERKPEERASEGLSFRNQDFPPGLPRPEEGLWAATKSEPLRSPISLNSSGTSLRISVPVFLQSEVAEISLGALVSELEVDSLLSGAARRWEGSEQPNENLPDRASSTSRTVVVVDRADRILYHQNQALAYQLVGDSLPHFKPVAARMMSGDSGWQSFRSGTDEEVWAAFSPFPGMNMSVAILESYKQAMAGARRSGVWGLVYSILIGSATAILLSFYLQVRTRGLERVSEGVAAIAEGKLDHRIELRSGDENRVLADNVNLMTDRLREQIARETEARQFQSFVRLSAMLTHDLKNAIEALSLIVRNMERHFDNQDFRADAMNSLKLATQNLSAMVTRLTNPVATLSGEYKMAQPTDIIPMLKRALAITAGPVSETHKIEAELPPSLFAVVDGERIEKVIENLVLNALEAMTGKNGTLTIKAGKTDDQKVFFCVTDTGTGMTPDFIEKRLYHPFATTKKKGVGLGLYTCREVVRANGGSIKVDSREGAGTTFRVVLPSPK
ncbi:MAG: HAMP domain-containing protein [Pyrinomonadaceae bacterium]|nr:HAMP domain-containing protein [Pyrinomonadaceae bacterium]